MKCQNILVLARIYNPDHHGWQHPDNKPHLHIIIGGFYYTTKQSVYNFHAISYIVIIWSYLKRHIFANLFLYIIHIFNGSFIDISLGRHGKIYLGNGLLMWIICWWHRYMHVIKLIVKHGQFLWKWVNFKLMCSIRQTDSRTHIDAHLSSLPHVLKTKSIKCLVTLSEWSSKAYEL